MTPSTSPELTSRETPSNAVTPPNETVIPRTVNPAPCGRSLDSTPGNLHQAPERCQELRQKLLRVLNDDALENVRRLFRGIDGGLEALVDVLPADDHHRVDAAVEQGGHRLSDDAIAFVLQAVDLDRVMRSEEHTSELQSRQYLVCRLLLEKKNK